MNYTPTDTERIADLEAELANSRRIAGNNADLWAEAQERIKGMEEELRKILCWVVWQSGPDMGMNSYRNVVEQGQRDGYEARQRLLARLRRAWWWFLTWRPGE